MALKRKGDKKALDKTIQNSLIKEDVATRVSYATDEQMKSFKIYSIETGEDMRELLDKALKEIMQKPPKQFMEIDKNAKKRSFAIKHSTLIEMKLFLVEHPDLTQGKLIYNSINILFANELLSF